MPLSPQNAPETPADPIDTGSARWNLKIVDGPDQGRALVWDSVTPLLIGRGSDSHTRIRDPKISRIHCELKESEGTVWLIDRGGAGGVSVDGSPVNQKRTISAGSEFNLGDTRLKLEPFDPLDAPTLTTTAPEKSSVADLVGQTLYRFRIDSLVTRSPSSVVFKAYDTRRQRVVALKVLQPAMVSSETQRDRFIRAMRTMLPIRHPNIVRLYKAGKHGPFCWAAMEWVDGVSVKELIDHAGVGGMLEWKEVWRVAMDIGAALAEADRHRISHRNVTPSNILRRRNDMNYLLTDLVFARALDETDASSLTRPGDVIGDLGYIAPERILDATLQDPRSDQYSLGATLYALLTGQPPHKAFGVADLIHRLRTEDPKPPAEFQLGLEECFSDVVMKLLRKTPQQRFMSPSELLRQLTRVGQLGGIETNAGPWQ